MATAHLQGIEDHFTLDAICNRHRYCLGPSYQQAIEAIAFVEQSTQDGDDPRAWAWATIVYCSPDTETYAGGAR